MGPERNPIRPPERGKTIHPQPHDKVVTEVGVSADGGVKK